jgi:S-(hydroxymethyl)glutathione dehydrogenase/alcohol dehydrogenase
LHGRADWCQFLDTAPAHPLAEMSDGTQIFEQAGLGGLSEIMVVPEEYCCPVFTDLPAEQLTLLGDTVGTGLAAGRDLVQIEPGWNVVVQGAGPVGMGAIQAARLANAGQVIVIEPIRSRREIAMKVGGTIALDPNAEGNGLIAKIHSLCKGITDRRFAGGQISGNGRLAVPDGADFVINAVGSDWFPPKVEVGPDPSAILPLQQCFDFTRAGGHIVMLGVAWRGDVSFNAASFSNRGRSFYSGQQGGLNMLRDIPRYVKLIEKGSIDMKSMITATYPIERTREAIQAVGDRTVLGAVITFA